MRPSMMHGSGRSGASTGKTPFFQAVVKAFHSVSFYDEVRRRWRGRGFAYLLVLTALASVLQALAIQRTYSGFVEEDLPEILAEMPPITLRGGTARVEADKPVLLRRGKQLVAILDTKGGVVSLENTDALVLLTARNLQMRGFGGSITELPLEDFGDRTLGPEDIVAAARGLRGLLPLLVYPLVVASAYFYRVLELVAFALLARIWTLRTAPALSTEAVFRLTAVALTPAVVVEALFSLFDVSLPAAGFFAQVVAAAYVFQTIRTAVRQTPPPAAA